RIWNAKGNIVSAPPSGQQTVIRTQTLGNPLAPVLPRDFERVTGGQFFGSVGFATDGSGFSTIKRSDGGSWVIDGFAVGDLIKITGDGANAGAYEIAAISTAGDVITLNNLAHLTAKTATVTITLFHGIEASLGDVGTSGSPVWVDLVQSDVGNETLYARAGGS